jgi:hypothetical protein
MVELHSPLLAHLKDDGGDGRVVVLGDTREEVVGGLVVESTRKEGHHGRSVGIVDRGADLEDGPFLLDLRVELFVTCRV